MAGKKGHPKGVPQRPKHSHNFVKVRSTDWYNKQGQKQTIDHYQCNYPGCGQTKDVYH